MRDANDADLRARLAAELNRDEVPPLVWDILEARWHIRGTRVGWINFDRLVDYARALLLYSDIVEQVESSQPEGGRRTIERPRFSGYETARAKTLAEYLGLRATAYPSVQKFRKYMSYMRPAPDAMPFMPEGKPLAPEKAHEFVRNPRISRVTTMDKDDYVGKIGYDYDPLRTDPDKQAGLLEFFGRNHREYEYFQFYGGSVMEWLHELSGELIETFCRPWREAEAAWFVLTGEATVPKALVGEPDCFHNDHLTYGTLTLKVEPWTAAEDVTKVYQYLQSQMLGRKPRALSLRNLAVARFVMRQLKESVLIGPDREEGRRSRLSWRTLMDRWNREHQETTYRDERQFYRDFHRAAGAVVRPFDAEALPLEILGEREEVFIPDDSEEQGGE